MTLGETNVYSPCGPQTRVTKVMAAGTGLGVSDCALWEALVLRKMGVAMRSCLLVCVTAGSSGEVGL